MKRYELQNLYEVGGLKSAIERKVTDCNILMGNTYSGSVYSTFITYAIYNAFYNDEVIYESFNDDEEIAKEEIKQVFINRLGYDIAVKFPYWKVKYDYILKLFTPDELSLLQTSRMKSESKERVDNAGGTIQKTANTPTGVNTSTDTGDSIDISTEGSVSDSEEVLETEITSDGYVDKYTNYQGKTSTASKSSAQREGDIIREGSIEELLKVLEKLPSDFANEITREVCKHFMFVYDY